MRRCHTAEEQWDLDTQPWHRPFIRTEQSVQYMALLARSKLCSMPTPSSESLSDWVGVQQGLLRFPAGIQAAVSSEWETTDWNQFALSSNVTLHHACCGCILWGDGQTVALHDSSISVHCYASDKKKEVISALILFVFPIAHNYCIYLAGLTTWSIPASQQDFTSCWDFSLFKTHFAAHNLFSRHSV